MTSTLGTAVITGGSAGIGRATARAFAERGYDVCVIARESKRLRDTEAELKGYGVDALCVAADVADAEQVEDAARRAEAELGPISVWVNDAMTTVIAPFWEMEAKDIQRITDVNYMGYVHGMQSALRRMMGRDAGTIVNIGSGLSYRGIPLQSAYCATKAAIQNLTESVRAELIHEGSNVHLGAVMPPAVNTPQFEWAKTTMPKHPQPVPPIYQPENIAEAVLKVVDDGAREVFVGKSVVQMVTGEVLVPDGMDYVLADQAWDGQQADKPKTPHNDKGNLYESVDLDYAARGSLDDKAKEHAMIVDADNTRGALMATGIVGLVGLGALIGRALSKDRRDERQAYRVDRIDEERLPAHARETLPDPAGLGGSPAAVTPEAGTQRTGTAAPPAI